MKRIAVLAPAALLAELRAVLLVALLAELLAGCASSPPSHFYSLTTVAPEAAVQADAAPSQPEALPQTTAPSQPAALPQATVPSQPAAPMQPAVRVAAVHIPPALDREGIVRRGPGNTLEISGLNRWGAPLDEMVQRVLTQDLLERLPAGRVVLPSGPAPAGTEQIVVDILQFQSDTTGAIVFEGSWSLLTPGASAPALIRNIRYSGTASPSDYGDQAAVMSTMLGRLADDIASSLSRH